MPAAKTSWPVLFGFILLSLLAGAIGSFFTASAIPGWYANLAKPPFSPPNYLFAPVWTFLYITMGIAAYLIWEKGWKRQPVRFALAAFGLQLLLNLLWSILFFGLRSPALALAEIALLWLAIAATIRLFWAIDHRAAYLLAPYIAWVSFAAILNASIWLLNG